MTTLALDGPACQQPMKTLKQWRKLLWRIVESLLEKLLRMSAYQLAHAMQFFRIFWVWSVWQRSSFQNCWILTKKPVADLLKKVITGEESWVYGYDVETKAQSSQWKHTKSPRPKKARQVRSNVKVLLTVFFDYHGVVHQEFLPQRRTVNKEYYLEVMRRLREAIRKKRPELWKNNSWLLHHENAPAHSSLLVRNFLAKKPYSPDLAPCVFFLFPRLKRPMKGRRFATIEEIKTESLKELKDIPKSAYEKCFEDWKKR